MNFLKLARSHVKFIKDYIKCVKRGEWVVARRCLSSAVFLLCGVECHFLFEGMNRCVAHYVLLKFVNSYYIGSALRVVVLGGEGDVLTLFCILPCEWKDDLDRLWCCDSDTCL